MDALPPEPSSTSALADNCACQSCGYQLRGLPDEGKCPECGTPIAQSLRGPLLRFEEPTYLRSLDLGFRCLRRGSRCFAIAMIILLGSMCVFGSLLFGTANPKGWPYFVALLVIATGLSFLAAFVVYHLIGAWHITKPNASEHSILENWAPITRWSAPAYVALSAGWVATRSIAHTSRWLLFALMTAGVVGFVVHVAGLRRAMAVIHPRCELYDARIHAGFHRRLTAGPLILGLVLFALTWVEALLAYFTGSAIGLNGNFIAMILVVLTVASLGSMIRIVAKAVNAEFNAASIGPATNCAPRLDSQVISPLDR